MDGGGNAADKGNTSLSSQVVSFQVGRTGVRGYGIFLCSSHYRSYVPSNTLKRSGLTLPPQKGRIFPETAFLGFVPSKEVDA